MNNSLIIGILVILLASASGYFYFSQMDTPKTEEVADNEINGETNNQNETPNIEPEKGVVNEESEKQMTTVSYTSAGFSPATVEIEVGDTVRFVNNSSGNMWVGSDDHPTHTIYPEFDQDKTVGPGGVYEFTFTKAGTWGYHNHVSSNRTGTVIVR